MSKDKKNEVDIKILETCDDLKKKIEEFAGQHANLKKDTLVEFCKDVKYEVEKLKDLYKKAEDQIPAVAAEGEEVETEKKKKRGPSGFAKPTKISKELCDFLGKPNGTEMARTEVTKYLTKYIKNNNLQWEQDKRKIIPDEKLSKLFDCNKDDDVTYFNLQKWMKPHFSKA